MAKVHIFRMWNMGMGLKGILTVGVWEIEKILNLLENHGF